MSAEENKAIVRRYLEAANQGREAWLTAVDELIDPDADIVGAIGSGRGPAILKQVVPLLWSAFPDMHITVGELVAEGEVVAGRIISRGTHQGTFMGIPPTGKVVSWAGMGIFEVRHGRIVRQWALHDRLAVFEQLGGAQGWERVPAPGAGVGPAAR